MKLKISDKREIELTAEVATEISEIFREWFRSVSDNSVFVDKEQYAKAYSRMRRLYIFGEIKKSPDDGAL